MASKKIILASGSPRRKELLKLAGYDFTVSAPDVDETVDDGLSPQEVVETLSLRKAGAVKVPEGSLVLAADTVVALDGMILGKPKNAEDAVRMLKMLSGKVHCVYTGVTLRSIEKTETFSVCSEVEFYELSDAEIRSYVSTGEPLDKAGAYGIQGRGALLVKRISGDYCNIVGLPIASVSRAINNF